MNTIYGNPGALMLAAILTNFAIPTTARPASIIALGGIFNTYGVTNDGSMVVGDFASAPFPGSNNSPNAFFQSPIGTYNSLGKGSATAVTPGGSVIVGWKNSGPLQTSYALPFRWTKSTGAVFITPPQGISTAGAFATSADGSTIIIESGGCGSAGCTLGGSGSQFYRWTQATGMVPIGFGGGWGTAASADGTVIVGLRPGPRAFRWSAATGAIELGILNGGYSSAHAVSADGSVVVGDSGGRAFRWTEATGMVDLGADGAAFAVSADGSIVVGGYDDGGNGRDAFFWSRSSGARLLSDVLHDDYGLDMSGWFLSHALAISPNGRFIVGRGFSPSGEGAWMVDLQVPEPRGLMLVGFASVCLFAPTRRSHRN